MPSLLSQIIGRSTLTKKRFKDLSTAVYHALQKANTYTGLQRTYRPLTEDGTQLPPETVVVQTTVLRELSTLIGNMGQGPIADCINDSLTLNEGNTQVKVDVLVEGQAMFKAVPPTFLMELKKVLVDIHTLVSKLPTLDPAIRWEWNSNAGVWESDTTTTIRTSKTKKSMVTAQPTDKHPAQVVVWDEDAPVGNWLKKDYSGAIPLPTRTALVARVEAVQKAVEDALAEANSHKVTEISGGDKLVLYIFQDALS